MRNETTPDPNVDEQLARVRRAEVDYLEAYRALRSVARDDEEARQDAETDVREARHTLRDAADEAIRALSRAVDGQVTMTPDRGLVAALEGRTLWYDMVADVSRPGWLGRDTERADARLDPSEVYHWLRAATV